MHKCHNLYSAVEILTTCDGPAVIDAKRPKPDICRKSYFMTKIGESPLEYCHDVWSEKIRVVWLHDGEQMLKIS